MTPKHEFNFWDWYKFQDGSIYLYCRELDLEHYKGIRLTPKEARELREILNRLDRSGEISTDD